MYRSIDASPVSCTFTVIISVVSFGHLQTGTGNVHKIFFFKPSEFQFKEPPLPSEFQKAVCHGVYFLELTQGLTYSFPQPMKKLDFFGGPELLVNDISRQVALATRMLTH